MTGWRGVAAWWLGVIGVGAALGLGSAAVSIYQLGGSGAVTIGPWETPVDAGGPGRGMYLRAATAFFAPLALSRQEAMYFWAATDTGGRKLRGNCAYNVHGADLPARWWSITLYGSDHYLVRNPEHRYSFASVNIARSRPGDFNISVGPGPVQGNWLDTASVPNFLLLARLYQPSDGAADRPASIAMPVIERGACR